MVVVSVAPVYKERQLPSWGFHIGKFVVCCGKSSLYLNATAASDEPWKTGTRVPHIREPFARGSDIASLSRNRVPIKGNTCDCFYGATNPLSPGIVLNFCTSLGVSATLILAYRKTEKWIWLFPFEMGLISWKGALGLVRSQGFSVLRLCCLVMHI